MRVMEVSSTMIYYENFCKCHNVPQYNKNVIILKMHTPTDDFICSFLIFFPS
jgi:hypothetical protein